MTSSDLTYTEAFAGSGEFAVVRLVVEINSATPRSLILLDEPEVSLHPGAQERLVDYLFAQTKQHKHQIVISTHSPAMIRSLPNNAIKVLIFDPNIGRVKLPTQSAAPEEALFYIGEPLPGKKLLIVEDILSKRIIEKVLRFGGEAFNKIFEIKYFPGGADTLWTQYLPIFSAEGRTDVLVLLDGDQRKPDSLPNPVDVPEAHNTQLKAALEAFAGSEIKFYVDGGRAGGNQQQLEEACRALVAWARSYVDFLPGSQIPEAFLWDNMIKDAHCRSIPFELDAKRKFVQLTKLTLGRADYEEVTAQEIAIVQATRLATLDDNLSDFQTLYARIAQFAGHQVAPAGGVE
ncbi:ATP-dependent nuclease [Methylobacterium sp. CM6244]